MNTWTAYLVVLSAAYLFGAVPFALILGRLRGIDIRRHGSGNIGATNLTRIAGRRWGILCFILDFAKGAGPVLLVVATDTGEHHPWLAELTAGAAVAGHVWPIYLRFKGGKGVATTMGALVVLAPWAVAAAGLVWWLCFHRFRYVSVASLAAAATLPLGYWLSGHWLTTEPPAGPRLILLIILAMFIWWRHRHNLQRLWAGTEPRFKRNNKG